MCRLVLILRSINLNIKKNIFKFHHMRYICEINKKVCKKITHPLSLNNNLPLYIEKRVHKNFIVK